MAFILLRMLRGFPESGFDHSSNLVLGITTTFLEFLVNVCDCPRTYTLTSIKRVFTGPELETYVIRAAKIAPLGSEYLQIVNGF